MRRIQLAGAVLAVLLLISGCGGGSTAPPVSGKGSGSKGTHSTAHSSATTVASTLVANARPQPSWKPYAGQKVPILVFHQLGMPPPGAPYPALYTPDAVFEQEMAWLHSQGYEAVTLDEMMNGFTRHATLPAKPVVITFDDGVLPQATFAPSVLTRYGWPGVLNEVVIGHLSNAHIEGLLRLGWEIGAHTMTHLDLTTLSASELHYQVFDSRRFLQRTFRIPVNSFCYPASRYDATVVAAVRAAGFRDATTETPGFASPASNPYLLPRFEMTGGLATLQADLGNG